MIIDPKTRALSLLPFKWQGATLRVIGTRCRGNSWFHDVLNEETREVKEKPHEWIEKINASIICSVTENS